MLRVREASADTGPVNHVVDEENPPVRPWPDRLRNPPAVRQFDDQFFGLRFHLVQRAGVLIHEGEVDRRDRGETSEVPFPRMHVAENG